MAGKSRTMAEEDLRAFDPAPFPAVGPSAFHELSIEMLIRIFGGAGCQLGLRRVRYAYP